MGIVERLNEPFSSGGGSVSGDQSVLPVSLDGRSYLVDTSRDTNMQERFRRQTVQLLNSQQNTDKGESALTTPEVWRRTYKSWHHGAGQKFADRDDSDEYRYDFSKGINPWERWEVSLLHDTAQTVTTGTVECVVANNCVAMLHADREKITFTNESFTVADWTISTGIQHWIATDGYYVYALGADRNLRIIKVEHTPSSITVTVHATNLIGIPGSETPNFLVMANYKLIAATNAGTVYDITEGITAALPSPPAVYTPPTPNVTFVSGCSGRQAVYLMSVVTGGGKTLIHGFDIVRTTTAGKVDTLAYAGVAAELPDGERGRCLYSYLGYIGIGTDSGFRFAAAGEGITYGPLIETEGPVTAFEGQDRFLYYAMPDCEGSTGVGRADLSQFVSDLQPAYASDLMASSPFVDTVPWIITAPSGKLMFGTADNGVWKELDTYVDSGKVIMSAWTFNVVDPKIGLYVLTQTVSNSGSGSLAVKYDDADAETPLGNYQASNQRFTLSGYTFHKAALVAELSPNTGATQSPRLYSLEMRSTYVRGKASEWQVPCILHDEIEMDNGTVEGRDVLADFDHLLDLYESGRQFTYAEDGRQWQVYATDFIWSPHERSQTAGWQGVFTLYFREIR